MRSAREPDPRSVRAGTKTGYAGDADAATWRKTGKLKRDAAADYRSAGRQTGPEAPQASSVDIVIDAKVREPRADLAQALELEPEGDAIVHGAPGVRDITTARDAGGPAAGEIGRAACRDNVCQDV